MYLKSDHFVMKELKQRVGFYDELKGVLILLVILGHTLEANLDDRLTLAIYNTIYAFHMPLFIFITGYFTKKYNSDEKTKQVFIRLIETLLIFQLLHVIFEYARGYSYSFISVILEPQWTLWYLYSVVTWKAIIIILPSSWLNNWKLVIGISFLLSLCVGFIPCPQLSLSRTITFLPFFMMGYYAHCNSFDISKINVRPAISIASIALLFTLFYSLDIPLFRLLSGKHSYAIMELPLPVLLRFGHYILAVLMSCCIISLVKRSGKSLIRIGEDSLFYYMIHPFIVIITRSVCVSLGVEFNIANLMLLATINFVIVYLIAKIPYSHNLLNPITNFKK